MTMTKKKNLTIILLVALVVTIAVGATFAYLYSFTDAKENVFTFAENIKGNLSEPSWDPDDALNLTPGKEIAKDPQIKNISENGVVEYAAIKLTFLDGAGNEISAANMVTLLNLVEIDWSNNWTLKDGTLTTSAGTVTAASAEQIWVFNNTLPQGVTTDPIFYSITIPESITPDNLKWLAGDYGHNETDGCYVAGAHDTALCTISYRHHEKCALFGGTATAAQIEGTVGGGTIGGKTCDCTAVTIHNSKCPSLIKTLKDDCTLHTSVVSGLGNFTIKVEGAVVQADVFDDVNEAATALISLFA